MSTAPKGPPDAPRAVPMWRRRVAAAMTERLALKGTAVLLTVILWFIVSAKEPTEDLITVRFAPNLDSSLVLRDPPPPIRALVVGTGRDLLKLYAQPPIINRDIAADSPDTVVIDLQPSDVKLPPGTDAIVRDVQPRSVTLRFEPTATRLVPVRPAIQITTDSASPAMGPMAVRLEPESVEVSGPRLRVGGIGFVSTVRTAIPATDSLPHLVDIDTSRLSGARVKPNQVKVHLTPPRASTAAAGPARGRGS